MNDLAVIFLVAFGVWAVGALGGRFHTEHFDVGVLTPRNRRVLRWAGGLVMLVALFLVLTKAFQEQFGGGVAEDEPANNMVIEKALPPTSTAPEAILDAPPTEAAPSRAAPPPDQTPTKAPLRPTAPQPRPAPRNDGPVETQQPTVQNNCVISGGTNYGTQNQVCVR